MSEATSISSLKAVFRFPFQGPHWRDRFLVGAALTCAGFFVPIVPTLLVFGYTLTVMRQAIQGHELTLPAWTEWNTFFRDGLRGFAASLVYLAPGLLVMIVGMLVYFAMSFTTPMMLDNAGPGTAGPLVFTMLALVLGSLVIMMLSLFLGTLLCLLGGLPLPLATAHLIAQDKLAAAFHVRAWWRLLMANRLGYFVSLVVAAGLFVILYTAIVLAYYTVILCCFMPFIAAPIGFYVSLVSAALFGQAYRESADLLQAANKATPGT